MKLEAGGAMFTVAKDAARPFLVLTEHGVVRVTGTVFNVRASAPEGEEVMSGAGSAPQSNLPCCRAAA